MVGGAPDIYNGSKSLDAHAKDFYIVISVFTPLTTLAIVLRFYARKKKASGLASDDVFALLSYVAYVVMIATFIVACKNGLIGYVRTSLPRKNWVRSSKLIYSFPMMSSLIMTAAKFSVLLLYRRVFLPIAAFRMGIWIVGGLCFAWFIIAEIPVIFRCRPINGGWDDLVAALPTTTCVDVLAWQAAVEATSSVLDFVVAGLAISVLRDLRMNKAQRIGLVVLFGLTAAVAIIGPVRVGIIYRRDIVSSDLNAMLVIVQSAITVICCCIPTYGSLVTRMGRRTRMFQTYIVKTTGSGRFTWSKSRTQGRSTATESDSQVPDDIPLSSYWGAQSSQSVERA